MPASKNPVIITYNGVDGACAAAMALLKFPKADLRISSAANIGKTFAELAKQGRSPEEIHVCGVGVFCDWTELHKPARDLKSGGCKVYWYCGRGYLEKDQDAFAAFAEPVFLRVQSNTEALCQSLQVLMHPRAEVLLKLAEHDQKVMKADHKPDAEESRWMNLLQASTAAYFKYRDTNAFARSVRKLAEGTMDPNDERMIEVFLKTGYKYVLTGHSPQLKKLKQLVHKCAGIDEPVLITGETGVGKEHVAHLIYEGGSRATGPFVPINCANFAGNAGLANSALFGHVKGAFTGAADKRAGAFVSANGGVLFLDELGELPLEVQTKFLRVLDDALIFPEGSDQPDPKTPVSVRVIAATNRNLPAMIRRGQFRADLYHRLTTFRIHVPPLRERKEDIDDIVERSLGDMPAPANDYELTPEERELFHSYDWPGNVRQLNKVLKRALYLELPIAEVLADEKAQGSLVVDEDGASEPAEGMLPSSKDQVRSIEEIRRAYAAKALELHSGNWTATAKALGVAVNTLRAIGGTP